MSENDQLVEGLELAFGIVRKVYDQTPGDTHTVYQATLAAIRAAIEKLSRGEDWEP